jgi:hypothetical protein
MRKYALSVVLASAILPTPVGLPNQANATTIGAQNAKLWRSYYQSPPFAHYSYRPWPYYNYFLGWPTYGRPVPRYEARGGSSGGHGFLSLEH